MERLVEQWIAVLFVILTTVTKLFGCTHFFKNIYKHIAWNTKGKIVAIVYVHGHKTITVLLVHDCVWQTKTLLFDDTNAMRFRSNKNHLKALSHAYQTVEAIFENNFW